MASRRLTTAKVQRLHPAGKGWPEVFIHGREISLDNKHLRLYQQYNRRP